jgi:uncharacterized protein (DUF2235 family)
MHQPVIFEHANPDKTQWRFRIFVFGFSRGAYTARALTGMLRIVGLLHSEADNLFPYALN